jgi:hypothetical protein
MGCAADQIDPWGNLAAKWEWRRGHGVYDGTGVASGRAGLGGGRTHGRAEKVKQVKIVVTGDWRIFWELTGAMCLQYILTHTTK